MIEAAIANEQSSMVVDEDVLRRAAIAVISDAGIRSATVSIAIVDDPAIHVLNRQYLQHDYPTDVLSFLLEHQAGHLEGQIIVSADHALRYASEYNHTPREELLLYVIHGALHLVGCDDLDDAARQTMREREAYYLAQFQAP